MKQKLIITFAIVMLLAIIGLMVWDFYYQSKSEGNPWEYDLGDLKKVDESLICYQKTAEIIPASEEIHGIAIDETDRIFITGKNKVLIYDAQNYLESEFPTEGTAGSIAVGSDGLVYLGLIDHIEVTDQQGNLQFLWETINDKVLITSIAVDDESVFVADAGNKIVYRYDHDGILKLTIGDKSADFQGFIIPSPYFDLALGREGQLWVVNPGKHEFLAFNKEGDLFSNWARTSMQLDGFSGCCNPSNIALMPDGSFVTSEKGIERVKIHLPSGDFKCVVAGPESFEEGTTGIDLAVNSSGEIFVLDPKKGVVSVYEEK